MKNFLKKAIVKADIAAYTPFNKTVDKLENF